MNRWIMISVLAATVLGCGSSKFASTDAEWETASSRNSELIRSEFDAGKKIFMRNCQTCHVLKDPSAYTLEQWAKIGPAMIRNVNKNEQLINAADAKLLTNYVMGLAKDPN